MGFFILDFKGNYMNTSTIINTITIKGLYGFLEHTIELKEEGITIIHGPNGSGKTSTLEIIKHFFNKDFKKLSSYDFKKLIIKINDKNSLKEITINREYFNPNVKKYNYKDLLKSEYKFINNKIAVSRLTVTLDKKEYHIGSYSLEDSKEEFLEGYHSITDKIMIKHKIRSQNYLWEEAIEDRLNDDISWESFRFQVKDVEFKKIERIDITKNIESIQVFMIKTQRLINLPELTKNDNKFSNFMIENYASDLSKRIGQSLAQSNEKTATHGLSFPERLINTINNGNSKDEEEMLRLRYKETEEKIQRILNAGLLFREKNIALPNTGLNKADIRTVLSLYLSDLNEKISLYDDLLSKIEVFKEIISNKIKNKNFHIHHDKGFFFTSKYQPNEDLKLNQLSSGEQHEIVLFYQLIFLANSGTYYLIDEPEISLHVDWQRSFLDDIAKVEKLRNHKFIVATHSPQIIGSRRSLCVALDGGIL